MADLPDGGVAHDALAARPTVFRDALFTGQGALVTGGGGGIGRAICYLFGRLGAGVVACGREAEKLERLEAGLAKLGVACLTRRMTIRDPDQVFSLNVPGAV